MKKVIPLRPLSHPDVTHMVVQTLQAMNYDISDAPRFFRQCQNVDFGLSAEHEFAAIAAWLGRCQLVHQLGQERAASPQHRSDMAIPDLLAVIKHQEQRQCVLIEVKTTKLPADPAMIRLRMKPWYLEALHRYGEAVGLPVLIAWHPHNCPFWMLFEPASIPYDVKNECFWFEEVMKNDLMGSVLGDFIIMVDKGAGITIGMQRVGPKHPKPSGGYTATMRISEAYWHGPDGIPITDASEGVLAAVLSVAEEHDRETDDGAVKSFVAAGQGSRAQIVLRMLAGYALQEGERIAWKSVLARLGRLLSRDRLLSDVEADVGRCIHLTGHQVPHVWPSWVPEQWKQK